MDVWYRMGWSFMEASIGSLLEDGKRMSKVSRDVLVQDYSETGHRCLDVETFCRALWTRQVRRLAEPKPHVTKDMVMYWVSLSYGHLRMGQRIFMSSCDFLFLPSCCPLYWRVVLKSYGNLRGLSPAVVQGEH